MDRDPLQPDHRRILRRINRRDEILKEAAATKNSHGGKIPGETGHSLKLLGDYDDFHFVKVDGPFRVIKNSAEFFPHAIFDSLNT